MKKRAVFLSLRLGGRSRTSWLLHSSRNPKFLLPVALAPTVPGFHLVARDELALRPSRPHPSQSEGGTEGKALPLLAEGTSEMLHTTFLLISHCFELGHQVVTTLRESGK